MRIYHLIGMIEGHHPEGFPLVSGGALPATIRTDLLACSECGAAVPAGRGQEQHDRWHIALSNAVGDIPVVTIR